MQPTGALERLREVARGSRMIEMQGEGRLADMVEDVIPVSQVTEPSPSAQGGGAGDDAGGAATTGSARCGCRYFQKKVL